jgi:hypothetical protein
MLVRGSWQENVALAESPSFGDFPSLVSQIDFLIQQLDVSIGFYISPHRMQLVFANIACPL